MPDLKNMMDDELTSLQREIKAELARRSAEKMINPRLLSDFSWLLSMAVNTRPVKQNYPKP
ncbi:hypothetical protein BG165_004667 [Salmonella enterica subsp. enterica serovar Kottbus]|nr:hypothetical protein [Salmonella enterica subsp. enterica serovar Kottbus]